MKNLIILFFEDYFFLRQRIPLFIYFFYLHFKKSDNPAIRGAVKTLVSFVGLSTAYAIIGLMLKVPFTKWVPFSWQYPGLVTWGIFFLIYYLNVLKITRNDLTAFTFTTLATVGGGWLYEICFFHPLKMWMSNYTIFLINGQILCLILLGYELKKLNFKSTRNMFLAFSIFLIFSMVLFLDFHGVVYQFKIRWGTKGIIFDWFCRVPACNFLISLLGGIENKADP